MIVGRPTVWGMSESIADDAVFTALDDDLLTECQGKLLVVEEQNRNLKIALQSARRIGAAIGILMAEHKITDDRAFESLRLASQESNRKLREIAEIVLETGSL